MHTLSVTRVINAPPAVVWPLLDDFGAIERFHPRVESSPIANGQRSGAGAERTCHFYDGSRIREAIIAHDPGVGYDFAITDPGKFPLETAVGRFAIAPSGEDGTKVTLSMRFEPKFGPLGWLMAVVMMKPQFRKILAEVLEGLETHATTGRVVGPARSLATA